MKGIKLNHHFKKQGTGANPMMFDDLDHILKSILFSYHLKDSMASLFLLCFYTAQRATGSVSVLFDDINVIMDPDSPDQVIFIKLTFNQMKGLRGDPKISKRICRNNDDDEMCFITVFVKYLKSKYNIEIQQFNKKKKEKRFNKRKIWNISGQKFLDWVYYAAWKAGYDNHFFSPHSVRGGAICEMMKRAFTGDHNTFNEVFHQARVLGHWVNKSTAFKKYVKKPLLDLWTPVQKKLSYQKFYNLQKIFII